MRALGVLNVAEVEEPLGLAVELVERGDLLLGEVSGRERVGKGVLEGGELIADHGLAGRDGVLDAADLFNHVRAAVALDAGGENGLACKRADQLVAVVDGAVLLHFNRHVAVGAAQTVLGVDALEIGLHFGVLRLEHLGAGGLLDPVVEARLAVLAGNAVIVGEDRLGRHFLDAVIGHHGLAVGAAVAVAVHVGEVVLDVALAAGQGRGVDRGDVLAQGLVHVGMGHAERALAAGVVAVAGVAADDLAVGHDLVIDLFKVLGIDADALVLDHLGKGRGFAGQAVCRCVGALGLVDVLKGVGVAAGGAVVLRKAVALVDLDQIGVLLEIADDLVVVGIGIHGLGDVGVDLLPGLGANGAVLERLGRGGDGAVADVLRRQGADLAAVGQVIHAVLFVEHAGQQQDGCGDDHDGADHLVDEHFLVHIVFSPLWSQPFGAAWDAGASGFAERRGRLMTWAGHFSAHLPHWMQAS